MDESLSEEVKQELTELLRKLEARTELEACAVVSKEGMRIACAVGAELDADVYSAASAALVNLGETTLKQLRHGTLKEIIVYLDEKRRKVPKDKAVLARKAILNDDGELIEEVWVDLKTTEKKS